MRELRMRAGLTQKQLAKEMGCDGTGYNILLSQLEKGKRKSPSLAFIADYLRACRAGFKDITDILDQYTSRPSVRDLAAKQALAKTVEHLPAREQESVLEYEQKTTEARRTKKAQAQAQAQAQANTRKPRLQQPETPEQRQIRIRRMFGRQYAKRMLEERLHRVLVEFGKRVPTSKRKATCDHGRRVFSALVRTKKNPERRPARFRQLEQRAEKEGLQRDAAQAMQNAAQAAYEQLEKEGRTGWEPTPEEIAKSGLGLFSTVVKAEALYEMDSVTLAGDYWKKRKLIQLLAALEVNRRLEQIRLDSNIRRRLFAWAEHLCSTAIDRGVEAARQEAEAAIQKSKVPDLARSVAEQLFSEFEKLKDKLPKKPAKPDQD